MPHCRIRCTKNHSFGETNASFLHVPTTNVCHLLHFIFRLNLNQCVATCTQTEFIASIALHCRMAMDIYTSNYVQHKDKRTVRALTTEDNLFYLIINSQLCIDRLRRQRDTMLALRFGRTGGSHHDCELPHIVI